MPRLALSASSRPIVSRAAAVVLAIGGGCALAVCYLTLGEAFDAVRGGVRPAERDYAVMAGTVIVAALAAWGVPALAGRDQPREEHRERAAVVRHIFALGAAERTRERAGRIVSTATDGVERAAAYRGTFLAPMIGSLAVPLAVLTILGAAVDPVSALVLAIALPAIPATLGVFQSIFRKVSSAYRASSRAASAQFLDAIQGLGTLRLLGAHWDMGRGLAGAAEDVRRHVMRLLAGNQLVLLIVDSLFSLAFVTAAGGLALVRFDAGAITAGQGLALVLCALLLLDPLDRVGQFFYIGMGGLASIREIKAFRGEPPVICEPDSSRAAHRDPATPPRSHARGEGPAPLLEFTNVSFAYDDAAPVLRDVTFAVHAGERVGLIGPSGAGKTTVADLAQAMLRPLAGTVWVSGRDARTQPLAWLRSQIAVVAQHTYLFTGTLRDNLLIAAPGAPDAIVWQALAAADLADMVRSLPAGLATPVGERGLALSGGQAQRVAIARAFLKDAPILILDEPTAHVDLASERAILDALDRLADGRAVLTISHRPATIGSATRVIVLRDGIVTPASRGTS
ncbi:MAG: ABC transporter ATP-binding protein/permease [Bifidobacteriaceae bacterium]|jgi:ABC-type multidrug transport system fused ATPase/permease subunit|nr:ABC transporter ATP-binding protein/permease [Bifidobacteriaceae bacterium]